MAETSTLAIAVIVVVTVVVAGLVGIGIHRARYSAAREEGYRRLIEDSTTQLAAVREELAEVRRRLAALEKLLSSIG